MQDTQKKTRKPGSGGRREGAGRKSLKPERTKAIQVVIPESLLDWMKFLDLEDRSAFIVSCIADRKAKLESDIRKADALIEQHNIKL